jgi:hypothetical protein
MTVATDPRDGGGRTSMSSFSICAAATGVAGTIESKVIPYSWVDGLLGITTNRRFGSGFEALRMGIGKPFVCAYRISTIFLL